jgi:NADH-quinone oxidoreductase subunit G
VIAVELAARLGADLGFESADDVTAALAEAVPAFAGITPATLKASRDGLLAATEAADVVAHGAPAVPTQGGYEFRLVVSRKLYDGGVAVTKSPDLAGIAAGASVHLHPLDAERFPATVRVASARGAVALPLVADAGVPRGIAWIPANQPDVSAGDLIDRTAVITDVRVESLP